MKMLEVINHKDTQTNVEFLLKIKNTMKLGKMEKQNCNCRKIINEKVRVAPIVQSFIDQ